MIEIILALLIVAVAYLLVAVDVLRRKLRDAERKNAQLRTWVPHYRRSY